MFQYCLELQIEVLVQESLSKKTWNQVPWRLSELNWWKLIRFSTGIPRHAFITWLAMRNKLSTWDKLLQWGVQRDISMNSAEVVWKVEAFYFFNAVCQKECGGKL